ncbi:MarR family transcriptional regulator, partial [Listeria monocytogenes]|nr:MarR family transcriptional regulator [Listeria monocytogenes]
MVNKNQRLSLFKQIIYTKLKTEKRESMEKALGTFNMA